MARIVTVVLVVLLLTACSSSDEEQQEKSVIRKKTDEVATEMVEHIQKPIDKAQAAKELQDQYSEKLKEQADN